MYVIPLIFFRVIPAKPDGILTLKSKYMAVSFRELIISLLFYHISSIFQEKSLFSPKTRVFYHCPYVFWLKRELIFMEVHNHYYELELGKCLSTQELSAYRYIAYPSGQAQCIHKFNTIRFCSFNQAVHDCAWFFLFLSNANNLLQYG